jgi:hypothetical protein
MKTDVGSQLSSELYQGNTLLRFGHGTLQRGIYGCTLHGKVHHNLRHSDIVAILMFSWMSNGGYYDNDHHGIRKIQEKD